MTVRSSPPPGPVRDDVVATVAGRTISVAHLEARLAEMRRGPRGRHIPPDGVAGSETVLRWILQELVIEAVVAHEVRAAGIATAGESARLSPGAVASLVARVTADVTVPEGDVRSYYSRNQDLYERPRAPDARASVAPFDDVRAAIEAELLLAARARAFDEWLDQRRRALVMIEPGFEHPGHPVHGVPSHRH